MLGQITETIVNRKPSSMSVRQAIQLRRVSPFPSPLRERSPTEYRFTCRVKSAFDYIAAVIIAVFAAPIILVAMALVKLTSRGPALYSQQRVGQFGRVFTIWKIRSMVHNCERNTGPRWCVPGDPRVTPIGKVLRALHIDELPQLWNVLRGEMSLIGPRPERPEIAAKLRAEIPGYDVRVAAKPGISGLAQLHLPPDTNVAGVKKKIQFDFYYIRNLSFWFDLRLIALTGLKLIGLTEVIRKRTIPRDLRPLMNTGQEGNRGLYTL